MTKHPLSFLAGFLAGAVALHYLVRAQAVQATPRLRAMARRPPDPDLQLRDRIRSRLGRAVANPKAVQVEVHDSHVMLRGHVLKNEVDALLGEVQRAAGSNQVHADLRAHDQPEDIPAEAGRGDASHGGATTWH
ncbi:hypothetical protein HHL11_15030 [Ramlibacter sp. G-1-2-2]|uniref:BON domain-containing protein n=1 Tax=Ramlibacter agri TaxID=2728837 RepID=A0A848H6W8_9BURK|nr:hypothetical protein [Ramlibacter agri]NML45070.1 hypothetical protein [Ramlibacter agri]